MGLKRLFEIIAVYQILSLIFLSFGVNGDDGSFDVDVTTSRRGLTDTGAVTFDVSKYGAKGDGKSDSTQGVMKAWAEVCKATTAARLLIPNGKFLTGELMFQGPCAPKPITIDVQGTLMAKPDCKAFAKDTWIYVIGVNQVTMTGGGTLHAQGEGVWKTRALGEKGTPLPDSVVFANSNNSAIRNLKLVNSKGFQMKVFDLVNFTADNMNICAPGDSPNTDGIHIGRVQKVTIINSVIGVGDDCISIGDGSSDITVRNITCGPGHGISIGSLGRYKDEKNVRGVHVSNCTLWNTTNGARIKTFRESPVLQATNITFENIIMKDVYNPIIIDQNYASLYKKGGSNVKISDVKFKNIRGSSTANVAVQLNCSPTVPCQNIELTDIDFTYTGNPYNTTLASACCNAKAKFSGKQRPTACSM